MKGYVYILSNPAMPNIYKIGCTSRNPYKRASDLYTTGVPEQFIVEYWMYIDNYEDFEKRIHFKLSKYNYNKEFFKYDLKECIAALKNMAKDVEYKEKYRTGHLKAKVEDWEPIYLERQRKIAEQEEIERKRKEVEQKRKEEEQKKFVEESNRACTVMIGGAVLGVIIGYAIGSIWPVIICFGIAFLWEQNL